MVIFDKVPTIRTDGTILKPSTVSKKVSQKVLAGRRFCVRILRLRPGLTVSPPSRRSGDLSGCFDGMDLDIKLKSQQV